VTNKARAWQQSVLIDMLARIESELHQAAALADEVGIMSSGLTQCRQIISDLGVLLRTP
jgi:hypothetical protein